MKYWRGMMNWPIAQGWKCETCGHEPMVLAGFILATGLEWGLINGVCRCTQCHTQYTMRPDGVVTTVPFSRLKDEYKAAAKVAWEQLHVPVDELTDLQWDEAMEVVNVG